jgi:NAD(P)-dependent dehydrogenase (short-subunit alcohol dehydrogenase family)
VGQIINVSSVNGSKGAFRQTNYSAAKAGMHGFTKALALEVARKGVTVNTISPRYIGTKMVMAIPMDVLDSKFYRKSRLAALVSQRKLRVLLFICARMRLPSLLGRTSRLTAVSTCNIAGSNRTEGPAL